MALVKCNNCGGDISSNADVCVHCGKVLKSNETKMNPKTERGTLGVILGFNIMAWVLAGISLIVSFIFLFASFVNLVDGWFEEMIIFGLFGFGFLIFAAVIFI